MPRENQNFVRTEVERIYLEIGFESDIQESNLRRIELLGVPGVRLENGESVIREKQKTFFDDLIVRKLFTLSRRIDCDYQYLKIWLWDNKLRREEVPYRLPSIDKNDLEIRLLKSYTKLERIYVLDNELKDAEYRRWCHTAEKLFTPLFDSFIAPPETPYFFEESPFQPFVNAVTAVNQTLDKYASMKQKMSFNTLIIQVD
ncbi:MAG: hypothetical protein HC836_46040 [Richelia sp. RM2_1_2]|nr:hypothetical protein [Richelia sp. RM2_1_2]